MNNYNLQDPTQHKKKNFSAALSQIATFLQGDKKTVVIAGVAAVVNTTLNLVAPVMIGHVVDTYIQTNDMDSVMQYGIILLIIFIVALLANYVQSLLMGTVGQRVLFRLRGAIFQKLQELPIAFFNQNKTGDLISRINNDTDKLNQFFAQSLIRFITSIMTIIGASMFILSIQWKLGVAALAPAILLLLFTQILTPWIKKTNKNSLKSEGALSGEISESLDNFEVVVAFNRRDYFRRKFEEVSLANYKAAVKAGIANNTLTPAYGLAANTAQLIVVTYGLYLIAGGVFTLGLLVSFLLYITRLYDPLKQMAAVWSSFQTALAGWDRIHAILVLESDLPKVKKTPGVDTTAPMVEFRGVTFGYGEDSKVLEDVTLSLQAGKTYALVGPTGGGKTTTASLMARLYDPDSGTVLLQGKDIRSYTPCERSERIGFILQEPFLFTGTIRENIIMGNSKYQDLDATQLNALLKHHNLEKLMQSFDQGVETRVSATGGSLSLGQKQLIAFIRAVLRHPDILILDEATANIDTITEQLLDDILAALPAHTTKVVIAHRLNTIKNASEIFFVNNHKVTKAGSMEAALDMLMHGKRSS